MTQSLEREIPWNYTSQDDAAIVCSLLGEAVWNNLIALRERRKTGRSARHILRIVGDIFVLKRNAYLHHEFVMSSRQRNLFIKRSRRDLTAARQRTQGDALAVSVIDACETLLTTTESNAREQRHFWTRGIKKIQHIVGKENCSNNPYDLTSHATDATDWRHHLPALVVKPSSWQEITKLVRAAQKLNLHIIPRGGGTGLTGGAVPLAPNVMMLNTERLNSILGVSEEQIQQTDGTKKTATLLKVQAGVTTENAMDAARDHNLVFATDPTSSWACTIGGNLAENAGGKSAVAWGTAIDNVVSFRMIAPSGTLCEVRRKHHPLRKILPTDLVEFEIEAENSGAITTISLMGSDIRKPGLWKDVSNKWLAGVPGLQKEGTDGVIVDATFLLHRDFEHRNTICLEFFGTSMDHAALCIADLRKQFALGEAVTLAAMEHFDSEYCAAINYKTKSSTHGHPKAVLLVDLGTNSAHLLEQGVQQLRNIVSKYSNAEVHVAKSENERKLFWLDRKKLGAIAKRTNAFKLNEDVVLPIEKLAEFVRFCDDWNRAERGEREISQNKQLIIATHMHAGDGNIHVNIPVFSNDREMLKRAHQLADTIMALAKSMGGAVSGEHGIGITKVKYLDPELIENLSSYRKQVDPNGIFNPRKLAHPAIMDEVFTPSFNLLGLEARILQHGRLSDLAAAIAPCIRCGKCKPVCPVHNPQSRIFFSPRDKILAIGSLIEATLYDTQRSLVFRAKIQTGLRDIADHCTLCHRCADVCPVGIDKGDISLMEREILARAGLKRQRILVRGALKFLQTRSQPMSNSIRNTFLVPGLHAQRISRRVLKPVLDIPALSGNYVSQLLASAPKPPPWKTLYNNLPLSRRDAALIIPPPNSQQPSATVFYFPGCGSERLYSNISTAAIYLLLKHNVRVVLPPPNMCCGFPHRANAAGSAPEKITLQNSIIFSRIREMTAYLKVDACVVTCGTCREGLRKIETENIFGSKLQDAVSFLHEMGMRVPFNEPQSLYHTPCHDSLDGRGAQTLESVSSNKAITLEKCCSEAGTLALSRPDIARKLRSAKKREIQDSMQQFDTKQETLVVTNCPSCVQGLSRQENLNLKVEHMCVVLAQSLGGKNWEADTRPNCRRVRKN